MDPRFDRLFSSLEAQFGAAVARAEEEAATDLALSLRQDLSPVDLLSSAAWTVSTRSGRRAVREVAKDHVRLEPDGQIVPSASAVFHRSAGPRVIRSERTLVQVLRDAVRSCQQITVDLDDETITGRPLACGDTHILVAGRGQESLLPLVQIRMIKLSLGG